MVAYKGHDPHHSKHAGQLVLSRGLGGVGRGGEGGGGVQEAQQAGATTSTGAAAISCPMSYMTVHMPGDMVVRYDANLGCQL